jgi:hypothetical protein
MTKQEVLEFYGRSVYQIRLDVALRLFGHTERDASFCLKLGDEFVAALQAEEIEKLEARF